MQKLQKLPGIFDKNSNSSENSFNMQNKISKLSATASPSTSAINDDSNFKVFVNGPENINVLLTDEVLANIKDDSLFQLEINQVNGNILMKSVNRTISTKNEG